MSADTNQSYLNLYTRLGESMHCLFHLPCMHMHGGTDELHGQTILLRPTKPTVSDNGFEIS